MNLKSKIILSSALALSVFNVSKVEAKEVTEFWTARTVDEVSTEVNQSNSLDTYTVQYGDTLSVIAKALGIDMAQLININQISDANKIYPNTVLKLNYGLDAVNQNVVTSESTVESQTPPAEVETSEIATDETVTQQSSELPTDVSVTTESENLLNTPSVNTLPESPEQSLSSTVVSSEPTQEVAEQVETVISTPEISEPVASIQAEDVIPDSETPSSIVSESAQVEELATPIVEEPSTSVVEETSQATTTSQIVYDNTGLQPQVAAYKEEVANLFGITEFSGYRPGDTQDHGKGLAIDFMVPVSSALGDQVAEYAISNMTGKGISYVIWKQRFYSPYPSIYGPAYTWNPMPDRGSITENHYDHVHVSFNG